MTVFRTPEQFIEDYSFRKGTYEISTLRDSSPQLLLKLDLLSDDEERARHLPKINLAPCPRLKKFILAALVRAGARHPGLRNEDLQAIHRDAAQAHYLELFVDLNALCTGLVQHLVRSLGEALARVVISSSAIDILHEYQSCYVKGKGLPRAEMARALRILETLREDVPVHIHQLPPGATRYFARKNAGPPCNDENNGETTGGDEMTYIAEDRQMIAAFWDYLSRGTPRIPVRFVTSDFSLAKVCSAEGVPFLFAKTPDEAWKHIDPPDIKVETLWFDPFALAVRSSLPHDILWELCLVFDELQIINSSSSMPSVGFNLSYDRRTHLPGEPEKIVMGLLKTVANDPVKRVVTKKRPSGLRLSFQAMIEVLPTQQGQSFPLSSFKPTDEKIRGQLRQVGEMTELFSIEDDKVIAGSAIEKLTTLLQNADYIGVNSIFRRCPAYNKALEIAKAEGQFRRGKEAGATTGWAITLGAGYKTASDGVIFGLAEVTDALFEKAVITAHAEVGKGQDAVPIPGVLDHVCRNLKISPIRYEGMMERCLGKGALRGYEMQRATVNESLPSHPVLICPKTAAPVSYVRKIEPGRGILLKGKLMSSLVKRAGVS